MNPGVDNYLAEGCGRCHLGGTPDCKVHDWTQELKKLRKIVLECDLTEEIKWSIPCYTSNKKNILTIAAFKEYCALSFFKGSLLQDKKGILVKPGASSQSARLIRFTGAREITPLKNTIKAYIKEAIELEKAGAKVNFKKNPEPMPEELKAKLAGDAKFKAAFEALTPGRQRGYLIHFSQPKQSATRMNRIEKCVPQILDGKGLHDDYKMKGRE